MPSQLSEGAAADRGGVEREMKTVWSKIQKSFRAIFYQEVPINVKGQKGGGEHGGEGEGSAWIFNRASAWYAVAYGIKSDGKVQTVHATTPRGGRYLGFGWIMGDILCQIPARVSQPPALYCDANDTATEAPSFFLYFGHHLTAHWNMQSKELFETMKIKMSAFKNLDDALGPGSAVLFGSVAQYLCDAYSDIDMCVPVPVLMTVPPTAPVTVPGTVTMTVPVTVSAAGTVTGTVQNTSAIEEMKPLSFSDDVLEGIPYTATLSLKGVEVEGAGVGGSGEGEGEGWTGRREMGVGEAVGYKGGGSGEWLDMPIPDFTLSPSISNPLHSPLHSPLHTPLRSPLLSPLQSPFYTFAMSPLDTPGSSPLYVPLSSPVLSPPPVLSLPDVIHYTPVLSPPSVLSPLPTLTLQDSEDRVIRELSHLNSTVAPVVEPLTTAMTYAVSTSNVPILRYVRLSANYQLLTA